ncbi:MAG: hypothetical protein DMD81_19985 [Candidatus Rokuibacteriota bacterium]|nr:MAG: hypothetical protein DMD81_19985 [Candidatus Rokubacteria bacterium]
MLLALTVVSIRPFLPSLVMPPGRFTPFTLWSAGVILAGFAGWVFWGGRKRFFGPQRDGFASYLLLAALVWIVGLMGFLVAKGFRYSIPWYLAGFSRPLGVGLIFVGLLREQVWLYHVAQARQHELESLHDAGQALARTLDPREILQTIATKAVQVLGGDGAVLFRLENAGATVRPVRHAGTISHDIVTGLELPVGQGAPGLAVARRHAVWTHNIQLTGTVPFPDVVRGRMRQDGLKAVIAIPLLVKGDEVFGALAVFFRSERQFDDADVELLSAFGAQASVAIENTRSFERLALKARNDETLQNFSQRLLEATDKQTILQDAVGTTRDLVGAECVGLFMYDAASLCLRLEAGVGWHAGMIGTLTIPLSNVSFARHAFAHREIVQLEDATHEERFFVPSQGVVRGARSAIYLPLGVRDQPIGLLAAYCQAPRRFGDEDSGALTNLAHQTALALEKVRLYAELQTNLEQLKETQAQLIQADKLKALGTLLSGMAHELNNPLSTILLAIDVIQRRHPFPEPARRYINMAQEQGERAARIIRELLMFARRNPPERTRVDLNEVTRAALMLQQPEFDLKRIRVVTALAPLPQISADAQQLQQVLLNLFSNATHAMRTTSGNKVLTIRSREVDRGVMLDVEDTGPGIAPENLHRVFDPFFTTKPVGEGTGLGLSLAIGIVDSHGGTLQVENVAGGGARFTIGLPLSDQVEVTEPVVVAPRQRQATPGRRGRILVVEDEASLRALLSEVLTGLGHEVEQAATGEAAMTRLEHQDYDVITLDFKLPDQDGKEIWNWLRIHDPALAARVLFVTGDTISAETEQFLQATGLPLLTKPLSIADITRMVDAILEHESLNG